jgi:hypothetical protein
MVGPKSGMGRPLLPAVTACSTRLWITASGSMLGSVAHGRAASHPDRGDSCQNGPMIKQLLYWAIAIAIVLQLVALASGQSFMPG